MLTSTPGADNPTYYVKPFAAEQTFQRTSSNTRQPSLRVPDPQTTAIMSDYGDDDYIEYDEWDYVEDEYMQADDLAEHAVASPPPIMYDEDALEEFDRFDYFNDLEYDSDGYFDDILAPGEKDKNAQVGQKRKRGAVAGRSKKKQRLSEGQDESGSTSVDSPVVWRSQADRDVQPKSLPEDAKSVALLKDWREKLDKDSGWQTAERNDMEDGVDGEDQANGEWEDEVEDDEQYEEADEAEIEEDEDADGMAQIDPAAIMAALQSRLAAAGGPLSGMDPQQLLQFAMRMAEDQDAGDDIAGEMADEMLNQGDDEDDEQVEANLRSWVTQQRDANKTGAKEEESTAVASPETTRDGARPPTPPSSQAERSVRDADEMVVDDNPKAKKATASKQKSAPQTKRTTRNLEVQETRTTRKRKADDAAETEPPTKAEPPTKKRATRSFDAPTAASQAKTVKTTRSGRVRR